MNTKNSTLFLFSILLTGIISVALAIEQRLTEYPYISNNRIETALVKYVGMDSAICGGVLHRSGSEIILSAGVCWSTFPNPTYNNFKIEIKDPDDSFRCVLNKLIPKQAYYVKAFVLTNTDIYYGPQRTFATDSIKLGAFVKGGQLFYVLQPGDPGYVADEIHGLVGLHYTYYTEKIPWSNGLDTFIKVFDSALFTGQLNTEKIVNALGEGKYAAKFCYDLVANGYADWYLPSKHEAKLAIKALNGGVSWCSTEVSKDSAVEVLGIRTRVAIKSKKNNLLPVRKF